MPSLLLSIVLGFVDNSTPLYSTVLEVPCQSVTRAAVGDGVCKCAGASVVRVVKGGFCRGGWIVRYWNEGREERVGVLEGPGLVDYRGGGTRVVGGGLLVLRIGGPGLLRRVLALL